MDSPRSAPQSLVNGDGDTLFCDMGSDYCPDVRVMERAGIVGTRPA